MLRIILLFLTISSSLASERIISTVPSFSEVLYELGLDREVVGVSNYCLFNKGFCAKTKVGTSLGISYEKIIKLKPTVILLSKSTDKKQLKNLKKLKIETITLGHDRLQEVYEAISFLGKRFKKKSKARIIKERMKSFIERRSMGLKKNKVLFLISSQTKNGKLVKVQAVGSKSFYTDILEELGLENILRNSSVSFPEIGREKLLSLNYDYVFEIFGTHNIDSIKEKSSNWSDLLNEKSKKFNYYPLSGDYLYIPGPSVWKIARDIKKGLEVTNARN